MSQRTPDATSPIDDALDELRGIIADRYPEATFNVRRGEEPEACWLVATVSVENRYDVIDLVLNRLVALRGENGIPVFVDVIRTSERETTRLAASHPLPVAAAATP